ncbi:lamin tail domain-containing protein [Flavobacterium sp. HXWNR29]|uniref:lamin tail domain-containing protein n=1 Tax=Flavobacterium odoriferum TaxID=2946604 RepID=UPI0021CB3896|nr:lamin tail domain-containing protein [Flavobacterium sp. HXWNR29]MCU4188085.1 lamin tail domain-containing protein [Flavobacterium sp. HXWNR29]
MKLKLFIVALFCSVLGWGQTTIFQFDFEGGTTPSVDNAVGTPAYSVIGTLTSATGTCNGAGSVTHSAWNTNDGYRFTVNTTGYNTLNFSYVERASNTAISTFLVRASTDGSTWTTIRSSYTPGTSCTASGLIALPVAFDNQSNVFIEIFKNVNAGNSGNNFRIDDVTLTGNVLSSNTITTTTPIVGSPFCVTASAGVSVSVPFTSSGTFTSNTYTAQLSNAAGSFASPVNIGTLVSDANSGTISATIPANTATGTGYLIRVVSNGPAVTGSNTAAFTINLANNSIAPVATQNIFESTNGTTLTVTETSTPSSRQWYYATVSGGPYTNLIGGATGTTYVPNFATAGTYYVVCVSTFACGTITSNQVQINVTAAPTGCTDLFISEYIEGSGNNKAIEIYNPTAAPINLATYDLAYYFNGSATVSGTFALTGTIPAYGTHVVSNSGASAAILALSNQTTGGMTFNGDDAIALRKAGVNIDIIGQIGTDPGTQWGAGNQSTEDNTIIRNFAIQIGDANGADAFNPATEWTGFAMDYISDLGTHANSCAPPMPEINVQGNSITILDGDTTPIVGDDTNFGSADIAGGTIVKTFTIQNTGTAILNIGAISFTGTHGTNFIVTTPPSATVAIGGSTTFQVTFDPTIVGAHNAEISIVNDDVNENPYNFAITGNGFATPNIVLSSSNPAVAASNITQGTTNNVIYAFNLAVTNADATLNNVVFNTSGSYAASNITNFKLWYSTDATFNSATDTTLDNETAALGTGAHTFTGFTRLITNGSTGYFFITTDIPCTSTAGNTIVVDAITTADLTFVLGNKSGTAFASGTHTIQSAIPNNVTGAVTSVCENGTATISWTAPAGCSDNVLVFATNGTFTAAIPTGNGGTYTDNAVFGSGTAFDGGFTVFKGTGTSVTVTGLTNGTTYRFKIFTRNDLNWSNGVEVSCTPTLAYCASGATNTADSEIENVTLVGYSTTISNNTTNACTTGVNNYTAMSADLQVGGTYTVAVEFGDCDGGTQYDGAGGVWIDWNNDGDFLDANEMIGTALVAVSGGNVIQNFTINVPGGQPIGNYRMRIVQTEGGTLGTINPCGTFTYGSTEDYTVQVVNACIPTHTVTTFTPTSGPVGTEVTINGTGLTGATVTFSGVNATIVSNSGTQIVAIIPAGATTGMLSVRDTQPCAIDNVYTIISSDVTSCEGASTTDLIIYELHDEQSGDGGFITLYNGTATTVNLADYSIYRAGDYGGAMSNYATLTGTIAPGALGVITVDAASCGTATNGDLSAGFNENDQIQLRNAAGTIVIDDVHAYIAGPGYYMVRNAGTLSARTTFVAADWATTPLIAGQCIPSAGLVPPVNTPPTVTTHPSYTPSCSATSVVLTTAGTEGFVGGNALAYQWFFAAPGSATWTAVTDGGIYSGATTASLTISSIVGVIDYQYYCQIRENTATCYTASNAIKITDTSATTWNGTTWSNGTPDLTKLAIINGTYNTTTNGDIDACSIVVNTGFTATITSGHYFNIQNDVTVNGTLNILNNGSLVQINDLGVNTGNISYERITTGAALDYVYWSSPVNGVSTPASGYNYTWNTTVANPNGGQGNWVSATNTAMQPALGYIMRGVLNRNFIGLPRNGVYTPTIARGSDLGAGSTGPNGIMRLATDDNWNLLGNPYPSAISINSFLTANTQLDGFVRLWTHGTLPSTAIADPFYDNFVSNYTASDYVAINGAGATSGPGTLSVIGAGQGFFVLMDAGAATTSTALFNNSMRDKEYSNSQFYRINTASQTTAIAPSERHGIWLDLVSPTNETTRTLVAYVTDATYGRDRMFDAITDYKSAQNFYSIINEDVMTIQGRPVPFDNLDKVPMGVKIPSTGSYTIAIGAVDGIFASSTQDIYLEDLEFGIIHDLRVNPYSFNATQGIHNSRFVLRYTNSVLGNEDFIDDTNTVFVVSNESLTVSSLKENITAIEIYDVLGRKLYQNKNVNTQSQIVNSIQKTNSGLIIYITLENGKQVVKKAIY